MAFKKFKLIGDVAEAYQLSIKKEDFMDVLPNVSMPEHLKQDLHYALHNIPYKISEAAIRENIIYPILREVFKNYDTTLMLWANKSIAYKKELSGMPDYLITKQSHLGKVVFSKPLMAVVEAKKDDFEGGWAQCLLEMYTIQKMNENTETPVYGIVSNGDNWEFGMLVQQIFTENERFCTILQLDDLFASLSYFFDLCQTNALKI